MVAPHLSNTKDKLTCSPQLSYGLSTEYANKPQAKQSSKFDAERQLYSKYYISQIMQLGEEGIHDAWSKVRIVEYPRPHCKLQNL